VGVVQKKNEEETHGQRQQNSKPAVHCTATLNPTFSMVQDAINTTARTVRWGFRLGKKRSKPVTGHVVATNPEAKD